MTFDRNLLPDPTAYFEEQGLKLAGPSRSPWKTTECKFHGGSDSMRINIKSGGWRCMSCGESGGDVLAYEISSTGLEFVEAAKAIGAWVEDGRPHKPQKPTTLPPRAALEVIGYECNLVAVAAANVACGVTLTDIELDRLMVAAGRINRIVGEFA